MHTHLTQTQLLLWTGQELAPDSPLYNMVLLFGFDGPVEVAHFKKAFQALVNRSDAMRTVFEVEDGVPRQRVLARFPYDLEVLEFENENAFKTWAQERSQLKLDVSQCCFDAVLAKIKDGHFCWYFNQHHLICDAWGVSVQYLAMADLYARAARPVSTSSADRSAVEIPPFSQFIDFEKNARSLPNRADIELFWKEKLAGQPAPPKLLGHTNSTSSTLAGRTSLDLGPERSERLRALATEKDLRTWTQNLTLFNIFSTLLFAYLYRVGGQRKLAIGAPAHNRPTPEFKSTPGVFIEIFPLLAEVGEGDSFGSLYQRVRNGSNEFLRYAQPGAGSPSLSRSFNVVLNYIHATFPDFNGIPTRSEWLHPGHCDPRHHLRLHVHDFDTSGSIQLHFDLNTEVFDEKMQGAVPGHFLRLLDAFLEDRSQEVGRPPLGSTGFSLSGSTPFRAAAAQGGVNAAYPDSLKAVLPGAEVRFNGQTISYQTLEETSNQLAHFLKNKGIGRGHRVAIFLKRTPDLLTAIFGVLKSGAAYVPIATDYPAERVAWMLGDAQAALLISQKKLEGRLPETPVPLLLMDEERLVLQKEKKEKPAAEIHPEDPAYVMYTSGSSGRPKGVMIPHRSLDNYIEWAASQYVTSAAPAMPLFTSIGFDLTVTSIFLPLAVGGTVVIYEEPDSGPDLSLLQAIEENQVDLIKLTPSHLALLQGKNLTQNRLRTMIVGGEDFRTDLAKSIHDAFGGDIAIFNEYGPTEATVGCILHRYDPEMDTQISVPIGQPGANMFAVILDEFGNPVPDGVTGELYIGGLALALGYWNQSELTAERFSHSPFTIHHSPFYKTGDLARRNRHGQFEYLGRKDQQVKIGGIRIELGEIEAALGSHPAILNCVVELRERHPQPAPAEVHHCSECGLPSNYPTAEFDEKGVCNLCRSFGKYRRKARKYFKNLDELEALFAEAKTKITGHHDCLMLFSGGKDSTYALGQLVEMGLRVLAFTLDNGYISEQAKANIRRVVGELGVEHVFGETPAMNDIFVDSLHRHHNVCNGCFKTIYTLGIQLALERGIPIIVTGLSRGQFFETRLTEELFWDDDVDVAAIDRTILDARKAYHRVDDAVCRLLDVSMFEKEEVFEKVQFVDFYRYTDVSLDEMYAYLDSRLPWVRPTDTGRSTNCRINQVGIFVHKKTQGYNNYAFPYSWDVRMGHKQRDAVLEEINEEIDEREVKKIMAEIGYVEEQTGGKQLVAWFVSNEKISSTDLRQHLAARLPDYMIPTHFIQLDALPLTPNGKIDRRALPEPGGVRPSLDTGYVAPRNDIEELIAQRWSEVLQVDRVGIHDHFLELGGHSLAAIRLVARMNEAMHLQLPVTCVFERPTVAGLAGLVEETILRLMGETGR